MVKKKQTAGESMIAGAKQALAFARGEKDHGCIVHTPETMALKKEQEWHVLPIRGSLSGWKS
jgi:hypothetical protein